MNLYSTAFVAELTTRYEDLIRSFGVNEQDLRSYTIAALQSAHYVAVGETMLEGDTAPVARLQPQVEADVAALLERARRPR